VTITSVETIPVSLPVGKFEDGMDMVRGENAPDRYDGARSIATVRDRGDGARLLLSNVIVKIHTDEGLTGIGEAACDSTEPVDVVKTMIDRHMAPLLVGQDPMDWEYLIDCVTFDADRGATRFSTSGIDLALHDLVAKSLAIPVSGLIGGCRREKVLASIEVPRGTPEKMAAHSHEYYRRGIRGIKAKVGSNPCRDAECIQAIRERLGGAVSIRADANCSYTLAEAREFCRRVERMNVGLEFLEQPLAKHDFAGFRELRAATGIPIEVDESAYSLSMVGLILRMDAADIINTKCAKAGGIRGVRAWAAAAEAFNRFVVIGTEWGAGLKVAAKLHLGAAVRNADPVVEFTEIMIHELLLKEPLVLAEGYLRVPAGPGLGLELDEAKVESFRTR
jgi:L-alanine-DL-glutamate epimerase-like enolase superfamily enzyme